MAEDIWDEINLESITYKSELDPLRVRSYLEKLKGKITQLHECLGEYETHEWCGHCIVDSKCAQITMHVIELKKKADILDFLFGEKGVRTENLMKLQIWREKAELWDQYAIYDNDKEEEILVKDLITAYEKLEAVRAYVEDCWLKGGVPIWVLERLDSILGTEYGKILEAGG